MTPLLRCKGKKTKLKKKKIAETEMETKPSELFGDFQTVLLSEEEDVAVIPSPDFTKKNKSSVNKTMRSLKPDC
jgi:hypothetical protein